MDIDDAFELFEAAIFELYPALSKDKVYSDSGIEESPAGEEQIYLWLQFSSVPANYMQDWRDNYSRFVQPFVDWANKQGFSDGHIMGDYDTNTLTFELTTWE